MNLIEVRTHLRRGAELIFTNDIPGGLCFALRRRSPPETGRSNGRSKLIKVQRLPVWAKVPTSSDTRSVLAALEMSIAREEYSTS